jgi:hypothetical protein
LIQLKEGIEGYIGSRSRSTSSSYSSLPRVEDQLKVIQRTTRRACKERNCNKNIRCKMKSEKNRSRTKREKNTRDGNKTKVRTEDKNQEKKNKRNQG